MELDEEGGTGKQVSPFEGGKTRREQVNGSISGNKEEDLCKACVNVHLSFNFGCFAH